MIFDSGGNLQITTGSATLAFTAWTPANWTSGFSAPLVTNSGCQSLVVSLDQNASITAGAVTWQGSYNGVDWVTIPAQQVLDPTSVVFAQLPNPYTFSVSSALNKAFLLLMGGYSSIRALESTPMTGAGASISPYLAQLAYSPVTVAALQTPLPVSGTITAVTTVTNPIKIAGDSGATLDAAINGAAPANVVWTSSAPTTVVAGACTQAGFTALATANVKASAGNVYGLSVNNTSSTPIYLQFYNTAGTPTLGTGVVWWVACFPGITLIPISPFAMGNFTTGIGIGASTNPNTAAVPSVAPVVTVFYK